MSACILFFIKTNWKYIFQWSGVHLSQGLGTLTEVDVKTVLKLSFRVWSGLAFSSR